jgi:hypothetical protein
MQSLYTILHRKNKKMSKFNCYGNPTNRVLDDIQKNDFVSYTYHKHFRYENRQINLPIILVGIWDGEKVNFFDKEKTVVRTKEWLKLYN